MNKVLTKAEEQVMQVLWKLGKSGLRDVAEGMPEPKPHVNTVATMLKILAEKGFVIVESFARMNFYIPAISKANYSGQRIESLARSYFDGSFSEVISFMLQNQNVSIEDLELLIDKAKSNT